MEDTAVPVEDFGLDEREVGNTLVLGAPAIGTSHRLEQLAADHHKIHPVKSLEEQSDDGVVVVDEFDRAWRAAPQQTRESFVEALRTDRRLCVATRPRALHWLLETDGTGFSREILDLFDEVVELQYSPEDNDHRKKAIDTCLDIANDDDGETDEGGLSRLDLLNDEQLEKLCYRYEPDKDEGWFTEAVGAYGPTVVPPLVGHLSLAGTDRGLLQNGAVQACRTFVEEYTLSTFLEDTSDVAWDVLSNAFDDPRGLARDALDLVKDQADTAGLALTGAIPLGGAVSLAIWAFLHENDEGGPSQEAVLAGLAGAETTPTARATLEAELGLAPRTLDDLHWLLQDGNLSAVHEVCEQLPERMDAFRAEMRRHEARLDELTTTVGRLESELESVRKLRSAHLRNAANDLDVVGAQLVDDEATLLSPLVEKDDIDIDDIPYFGAEMDERDDETETAEGDDGDPSREIRDIVETIREEEMVVLKGPHGTGKTTAAYRAGRELERRGYAVRVPNFAGHSASFVRKRFERFESDRPLVLFVSYHIGVGPTKVDDSDLQTLREWVDEGVCDCVVVECRSELHRVFDQQLSDDTTKGPEVATRTIEFEAFERNRYRRVRAVIHWLAEYVGRDPPDEERMEELARLADGNPEILKIAARFELSDPDLLAEIERGDEDIKTADQLVRKDLQTLFKNVEEPRVDYEKLFVQISVAGGMTTEELVDVLGIQQRTLTSMAEEVKGYLSREVSAALTDRATPLEDDAEWHLSPDIYASVTFRQSLEDVRYDFWWAYEGLVAGDGDDSYDHHLFGVGQNLGVAYAGAVSDDEELQARCLDTANDFVTRTRIETTLSRFVEVLVPLAGEGVPFDPAELEADVSALVEHAGETEQFDVEAGAILQFVCGNLYANYLTRGTNESTVRELGNRYAVACDEQHGYDPAQFLSNVYSMAIKKLADTYDPEEAEAWLQTLETSIRTCAEHGPHEQTPETFLAETRAYTVGQVTPEHPAIESNWHRSLLDRFLTESTADDAVIFYSQYHVALSQRRDIEDWLPWLVADSLDRFDVTDTGETDAGVSLDVAASVLAEAVFGLHAGTITGLDTTTGKKVLKPVADLATDDPTVFARLVDHTADRLREGEPADWLAELGAEPSDRASTEFVGHAYARGLVELVDADDEFPTGFHDDAVERARATADSGRCLVVLYSRALPWLSAGERPTDEPDAHRQLFESALDADDVDAREFYGAYSKRLRRSGSHDPAWFAFLATDAIDRLQHGDGLPDDEDERLAVVTTVVAEALHSLYGETGLDGQAFECIVSATEQLGDDDATLFERVADSVGTRLDGKHDNLMAELEWRTALGVQ